MTTKTIGTEILCSSDACESVNNEPSRDLNCLIWLQCIRQLNTNWDPPKQKHKKPLIDGDGCQTDNSQYASRLAASSEQQTHYFGDKRLKWLSSSEK